MENPHWVTWPSKQNTNATVAMECYHMRYNGYGGDTATWKQWIVGVKLRSGQLFADVLLEATGSAGVLCDGPISSSSSTSSTVTRDFFEPDGSV